jgi:uncharacterized iron-regulated membrane protein
MQMSRGIAIRKILFWLHLSAGVAAGVFIFIMAATGVLLSFERQVIELIDRNIRTVSVPNDPRPRPVNQLLEAVRRADFGDPTSIIIRNQPQAAIQFSIGRNKTVYVDPYDGAVLGVSSQRAHDFFFTIERFHRALGAPLGSKTVGRWLTGVANLLFAGLILMGIVLWLPRRWNWKAVRPGIAFRAGCGVALATGTGTTCSASGVLSHCWSSRSRASSCLLSGQTHYCSG